MSSLPDAAAALPTWPVRPPRHAAWGAAAATLVLAGLALQASEENNRALFIALNALGSGAPALWAMLSVLGLGLGVGIVVAALSPGRSPAAMQRVAALLWCLPIGGALTHLAKRLLDAPRPVAVLGPDGLVLIGEPLMRHAMPSGHAVTAGAAFMLCMFAARRAPRSAALAALCCAAIALSRVTTAAHWPADVLVGAGLGMVTALCAWPLARRGRVMPWLCSRQGQWVLGLATIGAGVAMLLLSTGYGLLALPMQAVLGSTALASGLVRLRNLQLPRLRWRSLRRAGRPAAS